jgi:hypothetical protein
VVPKDLINLVIRCNKSLMYTFGVYVSFSGL